MIKRITPVRGKTMSNKKQIPKEHQLKCEGCGKILDMRDTSILSHGWIEHGEIVCYEEKHIEYSSSKKVGDSILWTADKKPINLN